MMKKIFRKKIKKAYKEFEVDEIIHSCDDANYFGMESRGVKEVRGNGTLILTNNVLFFLKWVPEETFQIPIESIEKVSNSKSHMYRSALRELLKVEFINESGDKDSVAWFVRDLDKWNSILKGLVK